MSGSDFRLNAPTPTPPWHLWGSSQNLSLTNPPAGPLAVIGSTFQLAKVNFKRPDTWSFFCGAQIVGGTVSDVAREIFVEYTLLIGVGRTLFDTTTLTGPGSTIPFVRFRWQIPAGGRPRSGGNFGPKKWTTQAWVPPLDDASAPSPYPGGVGAQSVLPLTSFPAQDIQCSGAITQLQAGVSAVQNDVQVELSAWFAPRTHVRPDWFSDVADPQAFLGNETGGT